MKKERGMKREKCWWTVVTDCGTRRTLAVSRAKAIRNVRYRLVMDDRSYSNPMPRDFAEMRDIEILESQLEEPRPQDAGMPREFLRHRDSPQDARMPRPQGQQPHEGTRR